jgi:acetoin utilization protein AcuB
MTRIASYMTSQPWSVQIDDSATIAREMLSAREIRHLPVLDGTQLVGIVTERELAQVAERALARVEDCMTHALAVDHDTPLQQVLELMLRERRDAVVVMSEDLVAGIFTTMDAVRVLHAALARRKSRSQPVQSAR